MRLSVVLAAAALVAAPPATGSASAQTGRLVKTVVNNTTGFEIAVTVNGGPPLRVAPHKAATIQNLAVNGGEWVEAVIVRRGVQFDLRSLAAGPVANVGTTRVRVGTKKVRGIDFLLLTRE